MAASGLLACRSPHGNSSSQKGVTFLPPLGGRTDKQRPGRRVRIQDEGRPELSEGLSANRVLLVMVFQVVLVESECSQESSPYSPLAFHVFPPEPPKVCSYLFYSKTPKQILPSGKQQASAAKASGVTRNKANFQFPFDSEVLGRGRDWRKRWGVRCY